MKNAVLLTLRQVWHVLFLQPDNPHSRKRGCIPFFIVTIKNLNNRQENFEFVKQFLNNLSGQTRDEN